MRSRDRWVSIAPASANALQKALWPPAPHYRWGSFGSHHSCVGSFTRDSKSHVKKFVGCFNYRSNLFDPIERSNGSNLFCLIIIFSRRPRRDDQIEPFLSDLKFSVAVLAAIGKLFVCGRRFVVSEFVVDASPIPTRPTVAVRILGKLIPESLHQFSIGHFLSDRLYSHPRVNSRN